MASALLAGVLFLLSAGAGTLPALGNLLDPCDGFFRTARLAEHPDRHHAGIEALEGPVEIVRDGRGVPHIFAELDADAIRAMGYVVAQDRLFQMDFIARVAGGRLSEAMGPGALRGDRFFRRIGMRLGALRNAERLEREGGVERDVAQWYCEGVNAWIESLARKDLPFEFRLMGYEPAMCSAEQLFLVQQFMTYDLTFRSDDAAFSTLRGRLGEETFGLLYPEHARYAVPITYAGSDWSVDGVQETAESTASATQAKTGASGNGDSLRAVEDPQGGGRVWLDGAGRTAGSPMPSADERTMLSRALARRQVQSRDLQMPDVGGVDDRFYDSVWEGYVSGKGSNNWALSASRSSTGAPILAGDLHLRLTLPAIWYEVHLVTPSMNVYGVTVPGAPLPVEAFNDHVAWAFTNTGADQMDQIELELNADRTAYRVGESFEQFDLEIDTIRVAGAAAVPDTVRISRWGPAWISGDRGVASRWVAHEPNRTLEALWRMIHATDLASFEEGLRFWDTPMQNVLFADVSGDIAIRSTGRLPVRSRESAIGVVAAGDFDGWSGRVAFDELPSLTNPDRGYLFSANQDPTGPGYAPYTGFNWRAIYRSIRIDQLLGSKDRHAVEDVMRYQADVVSVRALQLISLLRPVTAAGEAERLRLLLVGWDGTASRSSRETPAFAEWVRVLRSLTWDEPEFDGVTKPTDSELYYLLSAHPTSPWLDIRDTEQVEDARAVLVRSLDEAAGVALGGATLGESRHLMIKHVTGSERLGAMWRGPFPYPGHAQTVSPATPGGSATITHSASWRVVVDLSTSPPRAFGVYPGGQSGNPFSRTYDAHVETYLAFEYYQLYNGRDPEELQRIEGSTRLDLVP